MNNLETPTWKNTLNSNLNSYNNIKELTIAASSVGYPYFTWIDGDVYKVIKEYNPKGYLLGFKSESTGVTVESLG